MTLLLWAKILTCMNHRFYVLILHLRYILAVINFIEIHFFILFEFSHFNASPSARHWLSLSLSLACQIPQVPELFAFFLLTITTTWAFIHSLTAFPLLLDQITTICHFLSRAVHCDLYVFVLILIEKFRGKIYSCYSLGNSVIINNLRIKNRPVENSE